MLDQEFKYYLDHQQELLLQYEGKYLVIIGNTIVGAYKTLNEAYFESKAKYDLGTFLVQKCSSGERDYTLHFHSRVAIQ